MKCLFRSFSAFVMSLVLILALSNGIAYAELPEADIVLHVATNGSDSNPGTEDKPLATIKKAANIINTTEHKGKTVCVLIHGGTYNLYETIKMRGSGFGGSDSAKVIYKAAGDGEVVVSGFKQIDVSKFTVIKDKDFAAKLPKNVLSHVGAVDLKAQGFKRDSLDMLLNKSRNNNIPDTIEYISMLLNGKEQYLAQWPNYGQFEKITEVLDAGPTSKTTKPGAVMRYNYPNINNWSDTSGAIVRGYVCNQYRDEWNQFTEVNKEEKTVTFKYYTQSGIKTGRNWRIINMPEELDCPGEYYIDLNSMILYFYPPYKISQTDVLELGVAKDVYFLCEEMSNVIFDGIKFMGFRMPNKETGIITLRKTQDVEIRNCTFCYNDGAQNIVIDSGKNNTVEACSFYNCGAAGVFFYRGGNLETLENQNNVVSNCHFYNTGTGNLQGVGGAVTTNATSWYTGDTVGNVIKNNLIHHIYGAVSVLYSGPEYNIIYNEISNGLRTLADYGLIYIGHHADAPVGYNKYNYLHDFGSLTDKSMAVEGIYFDDYQTGHTASNNFIVPNTKSKTTSIFSVGPFNTIQYNIIANGDTAILQHDRGVDYYSTSSTHVKTYIDKIPKLSALMLKRYPYLTELHDWVLSHDGKWTMLNAKVTDNIVYNAKNKIDDEAYELGTVENNIVLDDRTGVFVDPDNHDWRLTKEFAEANNVSENLMTEENFSMDEIGIQKDVWDIKNPLDPFRQVYPANGATDIQSGDVVISWENALYADEYKYVVATDPELKNVVKKGTSSFEFASLGNLKPNTSYYWKVTAVNKTKQIGAEWESKGVPYLFTTSAKEETDKSFLKVALEDAKPLFDSIKDGNGEIGDFKEGTEENLASIYSDANKVYYNYSATQKEINSAVKSLKNTMSGISSFKITGWRTVEPGSGNWTSAKPAQTTVSEGENGGIVINGGNTVAYNELIPNHYIMKFKAKADLDTGWIGFTLRQSNPADNVYGNYKYLIVVKKDVFEFQKYNPGAAQTGILFTEDNNAVFESNKWYDIEFGAVDAEVGTEVFFKVDGKTVFDYYDTENPDYNPGYFCVKASSVMEIAPSDNVPEGIYEVPEEMVISGMENLAFYDIFETRGENIVALKIGKDFAFSNISKENIPDVTPQIIDDKTYLPLRFLSENFGYEVSWNEESSMATVIAGDNTVKIKPGQSYMLINDEEIPLEKEAKIVNSRILIPIRDIAEALGKQVLWNGATQIVIIADETDITEEETNVFETFDKQFGGVKDDE